jgi:hypothetical protein
MRSRAAAVVLAVVALALACTLFRPQPTGGPALRDFESYVGGGGAWRAGLDPYGTAVWDVERTVPGVVATRDELLPFVGPPFGLVLWAAFAALPYASAAAVWSAVLALALAGLVLGTLRLAGRPLDPLDYVGAALFCAGCGPTISAMALGQVALLACGAVVGCLLSLAALERTPSGSQAASARSGAHRWNGLALAVGAGLAALLAALQPNLALVLAARATSRRVFVVLGAAALSAYALSAAALGDLAWPVRYAALLHRHGEAERGIVIQTTVAAVAGDFGADPTLASALGAAIALVALAILIRQFASARYDGVARTALACAAIPLALPFAHEHDFAIALVPALLCVVRAAPAWRPYVIGATLAITIDWLGLAQRPTGALQTGALTFASACGLALLGARRIAWRDLVPASLALVAGTVGFLAAPHALAMWPDTLGPTWHAAPPLSDATAGAADVWHQEQVAAGLSRTGPLGASLRALSLLGSALVWACAARVLAAPVRVSNAPVGEALASYGARPRIPAT